MSKELQRIFQLAAPEELLAEYSAWLFRSSPVKGCLYITTRHLCFHAFLNSPSELNSALPPSKAGVLSRLHPRKLNKVVKSWFVLNQSILSWYPSSHQSYFPTGQIDLQFCTHLLPASPHSKHPTEFKLLLSNGKTFTFRSDTQQSKEEWVKLLSHALLAYRHQGRNVKVVIPLTTIDHVEKCDSIQFAQTLRVKTNHSAPVRPFASDKHLTQLVPSPLEDGSLNDYFFGFLEDSQAPYDSINVALNLARSPARSLAHPNLNRLAPKALHSSLPPSDHPSSLPPPIQDYSIRDSTRFTIPTTLPTLTSSTREHSVKPALSLSQPQSGSSTPAPQLHSSLDERILHSKLSTKIHRIASSSHQFVGSPIRPASPLVKVHHSSSSLSNFSPPRPVQLSQSTPGPTRSVTQPSLRLMNPHQPGEMLNPSHTRPSSSSQSHVYPPKDRHDRLECSTSSREILHASPEASTSNSPIAPSAPSHDPSSADSHKPWGLLPGWLKNVPTALNSIKPSHEPNPQDPSDDEGAREALLSERDELKFQTEFNFLKPGLASHPNRGSMRLLLKTKCNLIRGGSSIFGQIYLATPTQSNSRKQKTVQKSSVCFKGYKWLSSAQTKMILPVEDLTMVKSDGNKLHLITNQQHHLSSLEPHELWFEFRSEDQLQAVHQELSKMIEASQQPTHQDGSEEESESFVDGEELEEEGVEVDTAQVSSQPIMFQSSSSSFLTFKPQSKLHITCLTIGSRGDVQPYIALCQKLQLDGHKCRIASHGEYRKWVEGYGIEYYEIGGDPAELMKICVDNGMFTLGFIKEAFSKFRGWLDELLLSSYQACVGTDLLIESPSTMAGIHIAEALQIPYFRAFTMPWTRTKEYPHAFAVPDRKMGGGYNYMTYTVFDQVFWKAMSGQVNKWRKEKLGLKSTTYEKLQVHKVPFLYNFSSTIVPCPLDWFEWIHVTGYWFIDESDPNKLANKHQVSESSPPPVVVQPTTSWNPPDELVQFLDSARVQNRKVVYIGFGSIVVPDPEATIQVIIESIKTAGVYGIISKGWSERLSSTSNNNKINTLAENQPQDSDRQEEDLSMIYRVDSIPHDWLFPRIHAVCHHGGAGTTGASLKAGIPTIIKPFFGDQFFWAERVETLGIGASVRKLTVKNLTHALLNATTDDIQIKRAQSVGEQIRSECGAAKAVECIYRDLEYAKSLIKKIPKPSDEITHTKNVNINPETNPRLSRNLSYSTYRKSSANAKLTYQNKSTRESVAAGVTNNQTSSSTASNSDHHDETNNREQMDLMGSSLLILPPSNATITTTTTVTTATITNTTSPSYSEKNPSGSLSSASSPNRHTSSSSENFFDCDLGNSKSILMAKSKTRADDEDDTNENKEIQSSFTTIIKPVPSRNTGSKPDNSITSDEDSSSWDILSQASKSGPSSNELSGSFDQF